LPRLRQTHNHFRGCRGRTGLGRECTRRPLRLVPDQRPGHRHRGGGFGVVSHVGAVIPAAKTTRAGFGLWRFGPRGNTNQQRRPANWGRRPRRRGRRRRDCRVRSVSSRRQCWFTRSDSASSSFHNFLSISCRGRGRFFTRRDFGWSWIRIATGNRLVFSGQFVSTCGDTRPNPGLTRGCDCAAAG
jgi:hypothetical protein